MPKGESRERLNGWIASLAGHLGTTPFPAHVTVAGQIETDLDSLPSRLRSIARSHPPLTVTLERCDGEERWFRCLFHHVARTPELGALREALMGPSPWTPHLSLCYGDLESAEKQPLMDDAEPPVSEFTADALHLWDTNGPVDTWKPVAVFPLG